MQKHEKEKMENIIEAAITNRQESGLDYAFGQLISDLRELQDEL